MTSSASLLCPPRSQLPQVLLGADFDQLERYGAVALLLKPRLADMDEPARILEVGCNTVTLLRDALEPFVVELFRCDVEDHTGDAPDFVAISRDAPLPFADEAFDYVVALEVLEHIPPEDRTFAISEWLRVARRGLILSCPHGDNDVRQAEERARLAFAQRHGRRHPWLAEHQDFELPNQAEVQAIFEKLGAPCTVFRNSPLSEWLPLLILTEQLTETGSRETVSRFNRLLNASGLAPSNGPAYRRIYASFKDGAEPALAVSTTAPDPIDPVVLLADRLRHVFQQQGDQLLSKEQETAELHSLRRDFNEQSARLAMVEQAGKLAEIRWQEVQSSRVWRFLNRLRGWINTQPRLAGSLGDRALTFDQQTPPGWVRIDVAGLFPPDAVCAIEYDAGEGFQQHQAIVLNPWTNCRRQVRYLHLDHPVNRWRLSAAQTPACFSVRRFQVKPCSAARVWASAMVQHLRECASPRRLSGKLRKAFALLQGHDISRNLLARSVAPTGLAGYQAWLDKRRLSAHERYAILNRLTPMPLLSIVLPVRRADETALQRSLLSVAQQHYSHWELLIPTTDSELPAVRAILDQSRDHEEAGIRPMVLPQPFSSARALDRALHEANGEWLIPIEPGDELDPDALLALADTIHAPPNKDIIYTDEDRLHPQQGLCEPQFKPDWSPDAFSASAYTGKLAAYRSAAARSVGGFAPAFDGAHEFDLVLRLTERRPDCVHHLSRVLYHRFGDGPRPYTCPAAAARVLRQRASPSVSQPRVSIVIPTAGRPACIRGRVTYFLAHCVESIRRLSIYNRYEIVVVDNGDLAPDLQRALQELDCRCVTFRRPFNLAEKINLGAQHADGDYLLLLNDDIEVITPDWIERLLEFAVRPGVAAVGAKLFFPDGRLQHVGVHVLDGNPGHPFYGQPGDHPGHAGSALSPRNYLAVTGACLMTPRPLFQRLGGFDPAFPLNYNDVDYCLRARDLGLRAVFTPDAELYHFEAVSKDGGPSVRPEEIRLFHQRWRHRYPRDPYYNDNLCTRHGDYRLKE